MPFVLGIRFGRVDLPQRTDQPIFKAFYFVRNNSIDVRAFEWNPQLHMASSFNRLCVAAARGSYRIRPRASFHQRSQCLRSFHTSQLRRADSTDHPSKPPTKATTGSSEGGNEADEADEDKRSVQELEEIHHQIDKASATVGASDFDGPLIRSEPDAMSDASAEAAQPPAQEEVSTSSQKRPEPETFEAATSAMEQLSDSEWQKLIDSPPPELRREISEYKASVNAEISRSEREIRARFPRPKERRPPNFKPGLMAMGEDDEWDEGDDEVFEGDDMTELGHGYLEQHREIREYYRIAAWEMPLLTSTSHTFPQHTDHSFHLTSPFIPS